jgi:hypothetical protein
VFGAGLVAAKARTHAPGRWLRRVELVVFNVCVTAVLAELALAGLARVMPSPLWMVDSPEVEARIAAHARPLDQPFMGFPLNALGHYDSEFAGRAQREGKAVAMIGDSFAASFVPHRYHYTTVAERGLDGIDIYNFGVPAIGPEEYLHLLIHQVLPIDPDAVVIGLFTGNDLENVRVDRHGAWLWSWFDRGQVRLFVVPARIAKLAAERARGGARSPAAAVTGLLNTEQELVAAYPWLIDWRLERGSYSEQAYVELARERALVPCAPEPRRLRELFRCLDAMKIAAADRPFGVVLLPPEFLVEDVLWSRVSAGLDDDVRARLDRDEPHASIVKGLQERSVPVLDLLPVLRAVPVLEDGDRHCYLLRDTHFNVRGNEVAGRAIGAFVRGLVAAAGR